MKVVTILGTRPEIIRLSRVMPAIDACMDHIIVHTGQNYDHALNQVFFDDLGLRPPDEYLDAAGNTASQTVANLISRSDEVLRRVKPDALLVLGDTNSCMGALAAKKLKIPIFHMEAGNRCFDQRVPEETNRRIVDHIADINLPYSSIAREYLLREGLPADRIIKTGSPMREVLSHYRPKIAASNVLADLSLSPQSYFVVSAHREENIDYPAQFERFCNLLENLATTYRLPVIVSTHPRTRKRLAESPTDINPLVHFCEPFCFSDYIHLQQNSKATLSDSGTITEESDILGFPAVNIREAHERPEGMEEAAVIMSGMQWSAVSESLAYVLHSPAASPREQPTVADYRPLFVSRKVVNIILSYTQYVRREVWKTS